MHDRTHDNLRPQTPGQPIKQAANTATGGALKALCRALAGLRRDDISRGTGRKT